MNTSSFIYNNINYIYKYNSDDPSGMGCINEIITRDEYKLSDYCNISNTHFIDIGANHGLVSMILAKQNPNSIVLAFEPDPRLIDVIETNLAVNNITNCKVYNIAVTKPGISSIDLYIHPAYSGGNTTCADKTRINNYYGRELVNFTVSSISFDEIIKIHNIIDIELLKIDCEGAEYDILYNSEIIKTGLIKNLVGEFHNLQYNKQYQDYNYNALLLYLTKYIKCCKNITLLDL